MSFKMYNVITKQAAQEDTQQQTIQIIIELIQAINDALALDAEKQKEIHKIHATQ